MKMNADPYLVDFFEELDESKRLIEEAIHNIRLRFENTNNLKDYIDLNKQVIQLIEFIKDNDLFRVVMMNVLEREVRRSFLPVDSSLKKSKKKNIKAPPYIRAKLIENVNASIAKVSKKNIDVYKAKIIDLKHKVKKLNEQNKKIQEDFKEEFAKNNQEWEQMLKSNEDKYKKEMEDEKQDYLEKQRLVAYECEAMEKRIADLSRQVVDLYKDKDIIRKFVSDRVEDIGGIFESEESSKSDLSREEDTKKGKYWLKN